MRPTTDSRPSPARAPRVASQLAWFAPGSIRPRLRRRGSSRSATPMSREPHPPSKWMARVAAGCRRPQPTRAPQRRLPRRARPPVLGDSAHRRRRDGQPAQHRRWPRPPPDALGILQPLLSAANPASAGQDRHAPRSRLHAHDPLPARPPRRLRSASERSVPRRSECNSVRRRRPAFRKPGRWCAGLRRLLRKSPGVPKRCRETVHRARNRRAIEVWNFYTTIGFQNRAWPL